MYVRYVLICVGQVVSLLIAVQWSVTKPDIKPTVKGLPYLVIGATAFVREPDLASLSFH